MEAWDGPHPHLVAAFGVDDLTTTCSEALTAKAQQYAIDHKGGLPRGLQTGMITIAVFLSRPTSSLEKWFTADPKHRYAALRFPVLADLETGSLTYFKGRMSRGWIYDTDIRELVVNGHLILPSCGHGFSPLVATESPHWWP